MAGVVSMWNWMPHASRPARNAWFAHTGELARWIAPAGSRRIVSKCHWITSGVIGSSRSSGVGGGGGTFGDELGADLGAVRVDDHLAAERHGQQLRAEADGEGGQLGGDGGPQQRLDVTEPGQRRVVVGAIGPPMTTRPA